MDFSAQKKRAAMADAPDIAADQAAIDIVLAVIGLEIIEPKLHIRLAAMGIGHIEIDHPAAEIGDPCFETARAFEGEKLHLLALVGDTPFLTHDGLTMGRG